MLAWILVFHLFGVIYWLGSLLVITRLLSMLPEEVGAAKERLILAARRLFSVGANVGFIVILITGVMLIAEDRDVIRHGWFHLKLLLVVVLMILHARMYRRIVALENEPASATRGEFSMLHGIVSALLLVILVLALLKPF